MVWPPLPLFAPVDLSAIQSQTGSPFPPRSPPTPGHHAPQQYVSPHSARCPPPASAAATPGPAGKTAQRSSHAPPPECPARDPPHKVGQASRLSIGRLAAVLANRNARVEAF